MPPCEGGCVTRELADRREARGLGEPAIALGPLRRDPARRLAAGLVAYGVGGLLILVFAVLLGAGSFSSIAPLSESLDSQRQALAASLYSTAHEIDVATGSVGDLGTSLDQARTSADQAAGVSREIAATMRSLSLAMGVDILGSQPLAGVGDGFRQAAAQIDMLGSNLDGVSIALGRNRTDLAAGVSGLGELRAEVRDLATSVEQMPPFAEGRGGLDAIRVASVLLAAWLAIPAVASLAAGVVLWRRVAPSDGRP